MSAAGQLARRIADQGWRGLLPILPADATPHVRLKAENAAAVEAGRGKAPGVWTKDGWSLLHDWRNHPDDIDTVERWASWPGVNVGLRACHAGASRRVLDMHGRGGDVPPGAVYIGRAMPRLRLPRSKWANDFKIPEDATREERAEAIARYRARLLTQPALLAALPELRGKDLACWCAPKACHGDVLLELAAAPLVAGLDVDVLHHKAAAEILELLRHRLSHGDFIWRVGRAPKFLIPVQVSAPVARARSTVVEIDGQRHMVELLGQGQQFVVAGVHPVTGYEYSWPAGGLEDTEPGKLPLLTPAELAEILAACSAILLRRHGKAVGRQGRPVGTKGAKPRPIAELRARDPWVARSAADYVINSDWARDDWVSWCFAVRGALGDDGEAIWLRFSAQSSKATNPDTAAKVWRDATQAERDGLLRSGAGTVLRVAREEGWTPPPAPGLPPYFDGAEQDAATASAALRVAVADWIEQGLAYKRKRGSAPPRHAIAAAVGSGKTIVTLEMLAAMAQGQTAHYYAPTLELGAEVVAKARALGLPATLIRGREANKKDPVRWPALCLKEDAAADIASMGGNVFASLCKNESSECPHFSNGCQYIDQFKGIYGQLIVLSHEYLTLPKPLAPKPALIIVDERFHTTLLHPRSLPLVRVTAQRIPPASGGHFRGLSRDARLAIQAVEDGKTMDEAGLDADRLRQMAKDEERLAAPPSIWPGMNYEEQKKRAKRLTEIEAFKLAKLWRTLAQDHDRITQRVIVARGIEWKGTVQDRVFIHTATKPLINKHVPVLLIDADHDPLISAATLPVNRRTVITPKINAIVTQVSNTVCSRRKLEGSEARRGEILALARVEAAKGRRVLIGTYKLIAPLLRAALTAEDHARIKIVHFGAIRGLDGFKGFETVIVAGREEPKAVEAENIARALFGTDAEPLLLMGDYVTQMRGYRMRDGSRTAKAVQVHCDLRVQAVIEQIREHESEQMAGRARLIYRDSPCHVFLLSNLPTALLVDRLASWAEIMPGKLEQAIVAGRGVLPLSYAELARAFPNLWAKEEDARNTIRKGGNIPVSISYWNITTLSQTRLVSYRRLGQARGSPHKALVPPGMDPAAALEALLGPVEAVTIIETWWRPTTVIEDDGEPAPLDIPFPASPHVLIPLPEVSFAFSGNVTVQRTLSTDGRTAITSTVKRVGRAEQGPEARAGP